MEVKFNAKKISLGNSYAVIIPKAIANLMKPDHQYNFLIKEVGDYGKNIKIN